MGNDNNIPRLKTINECAQITGLARYHVRQLVLQLKVKYIKAGKKYLINLNSLLDYLNSGEEKINEKAADNKIKKAEV